MLKSGKNPQVEVKQTMNGYYLATIGMGGKSDEYMYYSPMELILGLTYHLRESTLEPLNIDKAVANGYRTLVDTSQFFVDASTHFRKLAEELDEENVSLRSKQKELQKEVSKLTSKVEKLEKELERAHVALGQSIVDDGGVVKGTKTKKRNERKSS